MVPAPAAVCNTAACLMAANAILGNLSPSYKKLDPCANFQECESWHSTLFCIVIWLMLTHLLNQMCAGTTRLAILLGPKPVAKPSLMMCRTVTWQYSGKS